MHHFVHVLSAAAFLAGCAASPAPDPAMPLPLTLQPRSSTALGASTLVYEGASDSRCRPGVQCVWAGEMSYRFTLSGAAGNESFALTRARPAHDATTVKGARITLVQAADPPLTAASAPAPALPVTIMLTHP